MSQAIFFHLVRLFVPILAGLYVFWWWASTAGYFRIFSHSCILFGLSIIAWTLAYFFYEQLNCQRIEPKGRAVLVTGCDTGFGHSLALRLDEYGFDVFAGVLFPDGDGAQKLRQTGSKKLRIFKMDVTKAEDVQEAVRRVRESHIPLWALINNAGIGSFCPFDWGADVEFYQKMFDVNVFGMVRVTKSFTPLLRESKGRIVNVASLAGRIATEGLAHYTMAKHSVRAFSDILRRELYNSGIKVIILEPTFYKTEIINNEQLTGTRERLFAQTPEDIRETYAGKDTHELMHRIVKFVNIIARKNVGEVVDAMVDAITREKPKLYYRCCGYQDLVSWVASHAPEVVVDFLLHEAIHNPILKRFIQPKSKNTHKL